MNPSFELDIRDWLARYLAGEVSLSEFRQWFVPATWDIELGDDPAAARLSYDLELRFAEFSNGHWTEEQLKSLLRPEVESYTVGKPQVITGTVVQPSTSLPARVGIQFAAAHG